MNLNKALWEKGDFTRIARSMRQSGESLVRELGITEGLEVLDLGCGDGTTALPAAALGANVLGVDIADNLVDAGNARARELAIDNCRFQQGDACDLSELEDERFDLVLSMFGSMFAPCPDAVCTQSWKCCSGRKTLAPTKEAPASRRLSSASPSNERTPSRLDQIPLGREKTLIKTQTYRKDHNAYP